MTPVKTGSDKSSDDPGSEVTDPNQNQDSGNPRSESTDDGSQSPFTFTSGRFAGKTPEEVEEMFNVADATIRTQGRTLNEIRNAPPPQHSDPPAPKKDEPEDPAAFFASPRKSVRDEVRNILKEELGEAISPFMEDLRANKTRSAYTEIAEKYPNFSKYRQLVDTVLQRAGNTTPSVNDLEWAYLIARGIAAEQGMEISDDSGSGNRNGDGNMNRGNERPAPPQHRSSAQTISRPGNDQSKKGTKKQYRELDEEEKRYARMQGFKSDEEYIDYLDMDPEEVPTHDEENK